MPADGEVVEGDSSVDESMITGESRAVEKEPADEVVAGTVNQDGSPRVRVTKTGDETALAGILRLVDEAQQSKSRTQVLADRAAGWLFYVALAVAAITAVAWLLATGFEIAVLERVVTVSVITCPHALGLAVPLVVAINTSTAAQNGASVSTACSFSERAKAMFSNCTSELLNSLFREERRGSEFSLSNEISPVSALVIRHRAVGLAVTRLLTLAVHGVS